MNMWETIIQTLNNEASFNVASVLIVVFTFASILTYADIQIKDRVWYVNLLYKNKHFDYEKVTDLCRIQTVITSAIGVVLMFLLMAFKNLMHVYYLLILLFITFEIIYTVVTIKKAKHKEQS